MLSTQQVWPNAENENPCHQVAAFLDDLHPFRGAPTSCVEAIPRYHQHQTRLESAREIVLRIRRASNRGGEQFARSWVCRQNQLDANRNAHQDKQDDKKDVMFFSPDRHPAGRFNTAARSWRATGAAELFRWFEGSMSIQARKSKVSATSCARPPSRQGIRRHTACYTQRIVSSLPTSESYCFFRPAFSPWSDAADS